MIEEKDKAIFWDKVLKTESCWLWLGYKGWAGYGQIKRSGKTITASRYAYMIAYGEIPEGGLVLHRCDNPACVRPEHLYIGTHKDNNRDQKERYHCQNPSKKYSKKLSPQDITEIKRLFDSGFARVKICAMYEISRRTLYSIIRCEFSGYGG